MTALSIVLIVPGDSRRKHLAKSLLESQAKVSREFTDYPHFETLSALIGVECDVIIVDIDADAERALDLIENICSSHPALTVMVYSSRNDSGLLVRCMRVGARELLTEPVGPSAITEALIRASARVSEVRRLKKVAGKNFVFVGAKGGCGVTTLASNFAVSLARESGAKVALVDMDLHLGDAAITLGIKSKYSISDALRNEERLDWNFVETLLSKHNSGLMVLAASDVLVSHGSVDTGTGKVLRILNGEFDYVVLDAGSDLRHTGEVLVPESDIVYLVTQVSIPALRNSNRLIPLLTAGNEARPPEIVLNRFDGRLTEIDEAGIAKALTHAPRWRVPNDYEAVKRAQNSGIALALEDSPVSKCLLEMARAACGKPAPPAKKKRFGLF